MKLFGRLLGSAIIGMALATGAATLHGQEAPAVPATVHADAAPKHGEAKEGNPLMEETTNVASYVFTVLVFLVLLTVLRFTAWKPILAALKSREVAIREGLEAAARARDEAARTTRDLEGKIAEAQRVGAQALAQAKQDAVQVAITIKAQAEAEAAALKDRTLRDIEAAKQQAVLEINLHAAELGTSIARKILQRNVTAEDQERLVAESLAQLQAKKN